MRRVSAWIKKTFKVISLSLSGFLPKLIGSEHRYLAFSKLILSISIPFGIETFFILFSSFFNFLFFFLVVTFSSVISFSNCNDHFDQLALVLPMLIAEQLLI